MQFFNLHLSGSYWADANAAAAAQNTTALKGQAYLDDKSIDQHALADQLAAARNPEQTTALLQRLNGFYAWVSHTADELRAGVDHIRSRPLFYGQKEGRFYLSDDAEWVRQQVGDQATDPLTREEFQLAGYVTGSDTLFPNVKQLQAGEYLIAHLAVGKIGVASHRYYRFLHTEPSIYSEPALLAELDVVAVRSIQRLIDYAAGRQIVVPLSGGYDSRLIVTLLKRLGYDNILTFTYGVPGNKESQYSKQVAEALGLRWHFVEYSNELWRNAWQSDERWQYQKWGSGWSSIAHVQDWLAVKLMKEQGSIDNDAIFVPGHSGDFVAGSHIPDAAFSGEALNLEDVCCALFKWHYKLAPTTTFDTKEREWIERIKETTGSTKVEHAWQYADTYEKWDWQERQAKFICNSVRVYEFFGYDWWLPLWDKEFVEFWQDVPLELRRGREWCLEYVKSNYDNYVVEGVKGLGNASDSVIFKIKKYFKNIPFAKKTYSYIIPQNFKKHPLALYGRHTNKVHRDLLKSGFSILGLNAYDFLEDTQREIQRQSCCTDK